MKYNILGYNQEILVKYFKQFKIAGDELIILRVISDMIGAPKLKSMIIDDKVYTWIKLSMLMEELPLVLTCKRTAQRKINKLVAAGLIERKKINKITLPSGKIIIGTFGYYCKTQLNHDIQYKKEGVTDVSLGGYDISVTTNDPSTKELLNPSTKHLHASEEAREYIIFNSLDDNNITRWTNNYIDTNRNKISEENFDMIESRLFSSYDEFGQEDYIEFMDRYIEEKEKRRSVENFISYLERYERGM